MSDYSFRDLINLDNELFLLAKYEVSKGLIPILDNEEKYRDFTVRVIRRYNEFKLGIQAGDYTYDFLRDNIMLKYGVVKQDVKSTSEMVEEVISGKEDSLKDDSYNLLSTINDVLNMCKKNGKESDEDISNE